MHFVLNNRGMFLGLCGEGEKGIGKRREYEREGNRKEKGREGKGIGKGREGEGIQFALLYEGHMDVLHCNIKRNESKVYKRYLAINRKRDLDANAYKE